MSNVMSKMSVLENFNDNCSNESDEEIRHFNTQKTRPSLPKKRAYLEGTSTTTTTATTQTENTGTVKRVKLPPLKPLIFATSYDLNSSCSKRVTIGLEIQNTGCFEPAIRITDNKSRGVSFTYKDWQEFTEKFEVISDYFDGRYNYTLSGEDARPKPLKIGSCVLFFTTSYNTRAILLGKYRKESDKDDIAKEESSQNLDKTRKETSFSGDIVMQLTTFQGLNQLLSCIERRYYQVNSAIENAELCKDTFVEKLSVYLESQKILKPACEFLNQLLSVKCAYFEDQVKEKLSSEFVKSNFNIIFSEIAFLLPTFLTAEVRQHMFQKSRKVQSETQTDS